MIPDELAPVSHQPNRHRLYCPPLPGTSLAEKLALNSVSEGACIRWTGAHTPTGYGQINAGGKRQSVHRIAYELAKAPIPDGLEIDHLCSVRDCINPEHLEAVTHAENLRRMFAARRPERNRCSAGHEVAGSNIKMRKGRYARYPSCRTCFNDDRRRRRADRQQEMSNEAARVA